MSKMKKQRWHGSTIKDPEYIVKRRWEDYVDEVIEIVPTIITLSMAIGLFVVVPLLFLVFLVKWLIKFLFQ